jgi:hypothetical protein
LNWLHFYCQKHLPDPADLARGTLSFLPQRPLCSYLSLLKSLTWNMHEQKSTKQEYITI